MKKSEPKNCNFGGRQDGNDFKKGLCTMQYFHIFLALWYQSWLLDSDSTTKNNTIQTGRHMALSTIYFYESSAHSTFDALESQ